MPTGEFVKNPLTAYKVDIFVWFPFQIHMQLCKDLFTGAPQAPIVCDGEPVCTVLNILSLHDIQAYPVLYISFVLVFCLVQLKTRALSFL